jgi:hypothetical protein
VVDDHPRGSGRQEADRKLDLGKPADFGGRRSGGIAAICFRPQGLDLGTEVLGLERGCAPA